MHSEQLSLRKMTTDRQELREKNNGIQWEFVKVRIEGQISLGGYQISLGKPMEGLVQVKLQSFLLRVIPSGCLCVQSRQGGG